MAILFGREDSGLLNEELERCHYMLSIPSNSAYSSLNIAAAVQVIAYELHMQSLDASEQEGGDDGQWVTMAEMEGLYTHMQSVMEQTGFIEPGNPRNVIRRLRRLFSRTQLDENEINILRGMLTSVERSLK